MTGRLKKNGLFFLFRPTREFHERFLFRARDDDNNVQREERGRRRFSLFGTDLGVSAISPLTSRNVYPTLSVRVVLDHVVDVWLGRGGGGGEGAKENERKRWKTSTAAMAAVERTDGTLPENRFRPRPCTAAPRKTVPTRFSPRAPPHYHAYDPAAARTVPTNDSGVFPRKVSPSPVS